MLWQSPILDTVWKQYTVQFTPNKPYSYLTFVANNVTDDHSYIGVDALSDITVDGVSFPSAGSITASRDTVCINTPVTLNVIGNTDSIQWQSSETGNSFTDINNAKDGTYNTAPTQTTYYRAYAKTGSCDDTTAAYKVVVAPSPVAAFSYSKNNLQISFNSDSSKDAIRYEWDFGDGTAKSIEANPIHSYPKDTIYKVCLTVTNGSNCSFTICHYTNEVNRFEKTKVKNESVTLYPNPARNELEISGFKFEVGGEITVTDLVGRAVQKWEIPNSTSNIKFRTSNYPPGVYFVQIRTDREILVKKFIKE